MGRALAVPRRHRRKLGVTNDTICAWITERPRQPASSTDSESSRAVRSASGFAAAGPGHRARMHGRTDPIPPSRRAVVLLGRHTVSGLPGTRRRCPVGDETADPVRYKLSFTSGALLMREAMIAAPLYLRERDWSKVRAAGRRREPPTSPHGCSRGVVSHARSCSGSLHSPTTRSSCLSRRRPPSAPTCCGRLPAAATT